MTTTDKINELALETAEELVDTAREAAAKKGCGIAIYRSTEQQLIDTLVPLITEYLDEAQTDRSLYGDWEWSYMRDVVTPALNAVLFPKDAMRFAGFGPRSITMRLQKRPRTPKFGLMLRDLDPREHMTLDERIADRQQISAQQERNEKSENSNQNTRDN